jgi:hypothetical protein
MEGQERKQENQIRNLRSQQSEQVHDLEEQIKELSAFNSKAEKHKSEELASLIRDTEQSQRSEIRNLKGSYEDTINRLQQDGAEKGAYYQRLNKEVLKEKETQAADVIRRQTEENYKTTKGIENTYKTQINQLEKQRNVDEKKSMERLESAMHQANLTRQNALEKQAENYQETLSTERKSAQGEVEILQKALKRRDSSSDTSLVSPAAEAQIRNSVINEYHKALDLESEKNKQASDQAHLRHNDQLKRILEDKETKETRLNQTNAQQQVLDRSQYLDSVTEVEAQANEKIRVSETAHEREKERLYRQFANLMERQRRDYENILETTRLDAQGKLSTVRQESANQSKSVQRTLTARQNEIIREYDKKLADQKTEYEFLIEDTKVQARLEVQNAERRARQELELQAKGYEQRLAQLEAQNKERERYIMQNYQDELDRTRRSYELINKKKS